MRTVTLHNKIDNVKSISTLQSSMSDMDRIKQSSSYIAHACTLESVLSSGQG